MNALFHHRLLDGLSVANAEGGARFRCARRWRQADVDALIVRIAACCEAWLARHGFGAAAARDDDDPDAALPLLKSASVACPSALRQRRARRGQRLGGEASTLPPLCAASERYRLHAGVLIGARDRKWPRRLAERLVALVPPPRVNQVRYGGVVASRYRGHWAVRSRPPKHRVAPAGVGVRLTKAGIASSGWTRPSVLLWRVFGVDGLACPKCGKVMVLRAEVRRPGRRAGDAERARAAGVVGAGAAVTRGGRGGSERRQPRSPEPECSGEDARRGLGAAQAALTRARGVSGAGAVRGNRGFRLVPRGAAGATRGLRVVGQPVVAVGRGLGWALGVLDVPYPSRGARSALRARRGRRRRIGRRSSLPLRRVLCRARRAPERAARSPYLVSVTGIWYDGPEGFGSMQKPVPAAADGST